MPWPSFCKEQSECGCFMRPSDVAMLAETEREFQLGVLPDGSVLRGFIGTLNNKAALLTGFGADWNEPGFSRHLTAVSIMILQRMTHLSDQDRSSVADAATTLEKAEPENPFYAWLAHKDGNTIRRLTLAHCPTLDEDIARQVGDDHSPRTSGSAWWTSCNGYPDKSRGEDTGELGPHDYFLQRTMTQRPWCETSLWDCVVAGRLAGVN